MNIDVVVLLSFYLSSQVTRSLLEEKLLKKTSYMDSVKDLDSLKF